jgi:putative glutamine amidotransferase
MSSNSPRIAIPMPHSIDLEYAERAIPQYEVAVKFAGGEPVRIALDLPASEVTKLIDGCDGVLLPGSNADLDPARFHSVRSPHTASADNARETLDNLLLEDAYRLRKPILGICYGLQSLNVYNSGSLIQHIPDFLSEDLRTRVNHEAGKGVAVAHEVEIEQSSKLAEIVNDKNHECHSSSRADKSLQQNEASATEDKSLLIPVNSSHHQCADAIGNGLRIVARCREDGIIEALEGTSPEHFVLAVQWHPERSVDHDKQSRAIFRALIQAADGSR